MNPVLHHATLGPALRRWLLGLPWLALCALFGLTLGGGAWVLAGAIFGALLLLLLLLCGSWWVAMAWIVLSPTVGVFFNQILQGIPFVRADRILMLVLAGMFAFQVILQKRRLAGLSKLEWRMAAFLLLGIVHVLVGLRDKSLVDWTKQDGALLFDGYLMPMAGFFIARRLAWNESRARRFLWFLAAAALFLAVTAPLETLLHITWFVPTYLDVIHIVLRATGTFGNAAYYGAVMGSMLLLTALLYTRVADPAQRALLLGLLLAILAAIVLSKTRASWLGVAAGLAFIYVRDPASRPLLTLFGIGIAIAGTVALPLLLAMQGFQERVFDTAPVYNRIAGWGAAINMMLQNPLTGVGVSRHSFGMHRAEYAIDVGDVTGAWIRELAVPHNEFFNIGAMMGLVGFVLYLRVFSGMFGSLRRAWRDTTQSTFVRAMAGYVGAVWLSWCINASFADFANFGYANILIFFSAGIVLALADGHATAGRNTEFQPA